MKPVQKFGIVKKMIEVSGNFVDSSAETTTSYSVGEAMKKPCQMFVEKYELFRMLT